MPSAPLKLVSWISLKKRRHKKRTGELIWTINKTFKKLAKNAKKNLSTFSHSVCLHGRNFSHPLQPCENCTKISKIFCVMLIKSKSVRKNDFYIFTIFLRVLWFSKFVHQPAFFNKFCVCPDMNTLFFLHRMYV